MLPEEFNTIVSKTRLAEKSREAAFEVLVKGAARSVVQQQFGISRQQLHQILKTVEDASIVKTDVTEIKPSDITASLEIIAATVRAKHGEQLKLKEVDAAFSGTFVGRILEKTAFHTAQDVGRGEVILHSLGRLEQVPTVGVSARLEYQNGRASVTQIEKSIGNERGR